MTKNLFNKYIYAGDLFTSGYVETAGGRMLFSKFETKIDELVEDRGIQELNEQEMDTLLNLGYWFAAAVYKFLQSLRSRGYCFSTPTPPRRLLKGEAEELTLSTVTGMLADAFAAVAREKITWFMCEARAYEDGVGQYSFQIGENSNTENKTTTKLNTENEQTSNGTTRQRFQNGVSTNTTGTANINETQETGTATGTTSSNGTSNVQTPRKYDGDMSEWAEVSRKYRPLFASLLNSMNVLFIDVENLDDNEIVSLSDFKFE